MGWEQRKEMSYRQKEHERGKHRAVGIFGLFGRMCQRCSLGSDLDSLRICALFSRLVERSWRFLRGCVISSALSGSAFRGYIADSAAIGSVQGRLAVERQAGSLA